MESTVVKRVFPKHQRHLATYRILQSEDGQREYFSIVCNKSYFKNVPRSRTNFEKHLNGFLRDEFKNKKAEIIEWSQREDNKFIKIFRIRVEKDEVEVVTEYLPDYLPLTIIGLNEEFYTDGEKFEASKRYENLVTDRENISWLLNEYCTEMGRMFQQLEYYPTDISSNNILINSEIDDFRIIDVLSLDFADSPLDINTERVIMGSKQRVIKGYYKNFDKTLGLLESIGKSGTFRFKDSDK